MKKTGTGILVALAFVVWMGGCGEKAVLPVAETEVERSEAGKIMETAHVFSPETSWIWDDTDDGDTWMCLRKTLVLSEAEAKEVRGYLAALCERDAGYPGGGHKARDEPGQHLL